MGGRGKGHKGGGRGDDGGGRGHTGGHGQGHRVGHTGGAGGQTTGGGGGGKGHGKERQNRGWSQQRRRNDRQENFAEEARTALRHLEEERYALFCQQADSEQLLAKKRSVKTECLMERRHVERLSEELSALNLNLSLSSEENAACEENATAAELGLRTQLQREENAATAESALFTAAEANLRRQSGLLEEAEERLQQQAEDVKKVLRIYTGERLETPEWIQALIREQVEATAPISMPTPGPMPVPPLPMPSLPQYYVLPPGPRPMQATGSDAFRHFWRLVPALGRDCLSCRR